MLLASSLRVETRLVELASDVGVADRKSIIRSMTAAETLGVLVNHEVRIYSRNGV